MLYDFSKQIIQTYESLHSKLQELKDIISGTIRVATIYSIGLHDLPPYLKKLLKSYPTVNVHVSAKSPASPPSSVRMPLKCSARYNVRPANPRISPPKKRSVRTSAAAVWRRFRGISAPFRGRCRR